MLPGAVDCLTGDFTICPPVLSQIAAVSAFTRATARPAAAWLRDQPLAVAGRSASSASATGTTDGAFYVYADVSDFHQRFAGLLLSCWPTPVSDRTGIISTPHGGVRLFGYRLPGKRRSKSLTGASAPWLPSQ